MVEERSWKEKLAHVNEARARVHAELAAAHKASEAARAEFWQRVRADALGDMVFDAEERKAAQREIAGLTQAWKDAVALCNFIERLVEEAEGRSSTELRQRLGLLG